MFLFEGFDTRSLLSTVIIVFQIFSFAFKPFLFSHSLKMESIALPIAFCVFTLFLLFPIFFFEIFFSFSRMDNIDMKQLLQMFNNLERTFHERFQAEQINRIENTILENYYRTMHREILKLFDQKFATPDLLLREIYSILTQGQDPETLRNDLNTDLRNSNQEHSPEERSRRDSTVSSYRLDILR